MNPTGWHELHGSKARKARNKIRRARMIALFDQPRWSFSRKPFPANSGNVLKEKAR